QLPDREVMLADNEPVSQGKADDAADRRAIEDQPALPDAEELVERLAILPHIHQASADQAADEDPDRQVLQILWGNALLSGPAARHPGGDQERDEEHHPKAVNGDVLRPPIRQPVERLEWDAEEDLSHQWSVASGQWSVASSQDSI